MSIVLQGSTSGSITLQEPAVAGTTVLDLPAVSGTVLTTGSSGQSIPSGALPIGSVLQVVNATYSTLVSSTSSTFADTGLSATITPKFSTSKILVIVSAAGASKQTGNTGVGLRILRGATNILNFEGGLSYTGNGNYVSSSASTSYLDSPATTSATTYKLQFSSTGNTSIAYVNDGNGTGTSTITLMEIAA